MPIIVGAFLGGAAIAAIHSNYSKYSRYRDHSNYSDAAERARKQREAKQNELERTKERLQEYVNSEIRRLKDEELLHNGFKKWDVEQAAWQSFSSDYENYHADLTKAVQRRFENQIKNDIAEDEQAIRDIDTVIMKINQIRLTNQRGAK